MSDILVLSAQKQNRHLLNESLTGRHRVTAPSLDPKHVEDLLDSPFDLAILDGIVISRFRHLLQARKDSDNAVFLPYLLVSSRRDFAHSTADLWKLVDEILLTPVEKIELHARVEILLRARRYSLESEGRYSVLAESIPTAIVIEQDGQFAYCNELCREMRTGLGGLSERQLLANIRREAAKPENSRAWNEPSSEHGAPLEVEVPTVHGTRWLEVRRAPHVYGARPATLYVISDITIRKKQEQELILAKNKAEQMGRMKSAFLTNMSHEIRTPLTGIIGYSEILQEEISGTHQQKVSAIHNSGRQLLDTLNSVLDLAQLEGGSFTIREERIDVRAPVQEVVELLVPQAERNELKISVEFGEEAIWLEGDRAILVRVLNNVLYNAIGFCASDGITVSLSECETHVAISVKDTRGNVASSVMPHVYQEYDRDSQGIGAAGLGLSITTRLLDLIGGTIEVQSQPGVGSEFHIRLPKKSRTARSLAGASTGPGRSDGEVTRRTSDV